MIQEDYNYYQMFSSILSDTELFTAHLSLVSNTSKCKSATTTLDSTGSKVVLSQPPLRTALLSEVKTQQHFYKTVVCCCEVK